MDDVEIWGGVRALDQELAGSASYGLGPALTSALLHDPRHLLFTLARYKFAAKLLGNRHDLNVLEVGCSEGFGSLLLSQSARTVRGVDFDAEAIAWAKKHERPGLTFEQCDFRDADLGLFDAVVSIDVIEHVSPSSEAAFASNLARHVTPTGFCIVGTPNVTASPYASEFSKIGHVNLFDADRLVAVFREHFHNVFLFGMNDEVLHTGFAPMCHYLFVLCCHRRDR